MRGGNADGDHGGDHAKGDQWRKYAFGHRRASWELFSGRAIAFRCTGQASPFGRLGGRVRKKSSHSSLSIRPKPQFGRTMFTTNDKKNANAEDFDALGVETVLVNNLGSAGATEPRPIAQAAIPPALDGKDVIGIAQTGRGKTFAYLVPMIQRIVEEAQIPKGRLHGRKPKKPLAKGAARLRVWCWCRRVNRVPAAQEAELLTKRLRFTVAVAVGKSPIGPQTKAISDEALNSSWPPRVECGSWAKRGFSIGAIFRLPPSTKQIE